MFREVFESWKEPEKDFKKNNFKTVYSFEDSEDYVELIATYTGNSHILSGVLTDSCGNQREMPRTNNSDDERKLLWIYEEVLKGNIDAEIFE